MLWKKKKINMGNFFGLFKNKGVVLLTSVLVFVLSLGIISFVTKTNVITYITNRILKELGIYTTEVRNIQIESSDYSSNTPGSWHIDKSAKWIGTQKAQVTFDVNSVLKTQENYKDVILILDVSGSMYGEKLEKAKSDAKELISTLLSDSHNRVAIIKFNSTSEVVSMFSNDKNDLLSKLENFADSDNTNYNAALLNVNVVMDGYIKEENRDVVTLFLTDGYPNIDTPNQIGTYEALKDKYPYMLIHGIQYEMGRNLIQDIIEITDSAWVADRTTLNNVLFEASVSPIAYENFVVTDYVDNDYFTVNSVDDIKVSMGSVTLTIEDGVQKITWNLGDNAFMTGGNAKMTINLSLKDEYFGSDGYYPTNKKEKVEYKLPEENIRTVNSSNTPVLNSIYKVNYDVNAPEGCSLESIPIENYSAYQSVTKKQTELSCNGYLFKGWEIDKNDSKDIKKVNDDVFVMPMHDVTIRATWSKQSVVKTMDGKVYNSATLYRVLQRAAAEGKYAKEYTGLHQDSMDGNGTQGIYYWYADNDTDGKTILDKNNVVFAGYCWQMMRTTDTGGVKMIYNGEVSSDGKCLSTRGNHTGVIGDDTMINLEGTFLYGTGYSYDENNQTFTLKNPKSATWSDITYKNLVGKFTCKSESATCTTLYEVNDYYDSKMAFVVSYQVQPYAHYNETGTSPFNANYRSIAMVGYMFGDYYNYKTASGTANEKYLNEEKLFSETSLGTTYWYSDDVLYGSNKYSLINPYQVSSSSDYSSLVGKYTFRTSSENDSYSYVYYIAGVSGSTMYYIKLENGDLLSDYKPFIFGSSYIDNGNGTYTLTNTTSVSLSDWVRNHSSYNNKYVCDDNVSVTCSNLRYVTSAWDSSYSYYISGGKILLAKSRDGLKLKDTILVSTALLSSNYSNYSDYKYTCNTMSDTCTESNLRLIVSFNGTGYRYAPNHYWGSSVTWDGTNYTLVDPIGIEEYNNLSALSTHHYFCVEYGAKKCSKIAYVFDYGGSYDMNYILLENGTTLDQAFKGMLEGNKYNSTVKNHIDAWYEKNMMDYSDYLEDTIFCNDRSFRSLGSWDPNGGDTTKDLQFKEYNMTRDLSCANETDKFSVSNPKAKLKYKIGLMTSPELHLLNNTVIRKSGQMYWNMSPYDASTNSAVHAVTASGYTENNSNVDHAISVRPAISLIPGIGYTSGDGSMENPYVVELVR